MKLEKYEVPKKDALKCWREYQVACKDNPKDRFLRDMKKVYHQLKAGTSAGKKVIDIQKVIPAGGMNVNHSPKLAVAKASTTVVECEVHRDGRILFLNQRWPKVHDIIVKGAFPEVPQEQFTKERLQTSKRFQAPIPAIPASLRPKGDLSNYYILWEVEEWKIVPPRDPYLLRRITPNMFVVLAGWDLTELERSVMAGRL